MWLGFIRSGSSGADPRTDAGNDRVNSTRDLTLSLSGSVTYFLAATDLHLELPAHVLGLLLVLLHLLLGLPHLLLEDIQEVAALHLSHVALSVFRTELTCGTEWSGTQDGVHCSLFRARQQGAGSVSWRWPHWSPSPAWPALPCPPAVTRHNRTMNTKHNRNEEPPGCHHRGNSKEQSGE